MARTRVSGDKGQGKGKDKKVEGNGGNGSETEFEDAISDFIEGGGFEMDIDGRGVFDIVTDSGTEDEEQEKDDDGNAGRSNDEKGAKILKEKGGESVKEKGGENEKIEGEKREESDKKVEVVRKKVNELKIDEGCKLRWNLLDGTARNDIEWEKMDRFLEFMGRKSEKYGQERVALGWFRGENLVVFCRKFGKIIKGKNLMTGAFRMGISFSDRELEQIENANEILKERERNLEIRRDERGDERVVKRGRWNEERTNGRWNHGQGHYNDRGSRWGQGGRRNFWGGRDEYEDDFDYENEQEGWKEGIRVNVHSLVGYRVANCNFDEYGVIGLETMEGERCFAIDTDVMKEQERETKAIWNAVFEVKGKERVIKKVFDGGKISKKVREFILGGKMAFCCGVISDRELYKFRRIQYIFGTKRERLAVLRLGPLGQTNFGLNMGDKGKMHFCGEGDRVD